MPGLITHYICGHTVLGMLDVELKKVIEHNKPLYNIGAQGPDIFFYYLPGLILKETRGLGSKMHQCNFKTFFHSLCESIDKMKPGDEKNAAISYVCGYLTHYALDCETHPYIYYKSGFRRKGEPIKSIKYSVYHRNLETAIDVLMLKIMSGEKPMNKKLWELIRISKKDSAFVADLLSSSIQTTYKANVTSKQVYKAMVYMMHITRILQSKKGRRKRFLELIEGVTVGDRIVSSLIHMQELTDGHDYLNISKSPWYMPWDDKEEITDSFSEMFDKAAKKSKIMIDAFYRFLKHETMLEELLIITGNYSLSSGRDSEENIVFNFHDIIFKN